MNLLESNFISGQSFAYLSVLSMEELSAKRMNSRMFSNLFLLIALYTASFLVTVESFQNGLHEGIGTKPDTIRIARNNFNSYLVTEN